MPFLPCLTWSSGEDPGRFCRSAPFSSPHPDFAHTKPGKLFNVFGFPPEIRFATLDFPTKFDVIPGKNFKKFACRLYLESTVIIANQIQVNIVESTIMNNQQIKQIVTAELQKGTSLNDIQKLLTEEHQVKMTFLDLRLMVAELEDVLAEMKAKEKADDAAAQAVKAKEDQKKAAAETAGPGTGKTTVTVSKLVRPGALANGTVTFASGAKAEWIFDQMGRLGLDKVVGKPSEEDLKAFQTELQKVLSRSY